MPEIPATTTEVAATETAAPAETNVATAPASAKSRKTVKKAAKKTPAKKETKKAAKASTNGAAKKDITSVQLRILGALARNSKPLSRNELASKAEVDPTQVGNAAGYVDPEINAREVHAHNLLNKKYVKIEQKEGEPVTYSITAAGKAAYEKAKS